MSSNNSAKSNYAHKFESFKRQALFKRLPLSQQHFVGSLAFSHRFTFQEFRQIVESCRDLSMWGEKNLEEWWQTQISRTSLQGPQLKKHLLQELNRYLTDLKKSAKIYPENGLPRLRHREKYSLTTEQSDKKIFGTCPVAAESTVCCNLRTIDAVENCAFGCSYCTIQTFYNDKFVFDAELAQKLKNIFLEPDRFYHFGTGQSSDSLVWGNRNGILDALCEFASENPNVLLEFKTKSNNIRYFLDHEVPGNIVCSWSLNTPTIIANEEHFTANLQQRLAAAREVADRGIKVAFHFHPMVYYHGWEGDYPAIVSELLRSFGTQEVLFISFGSVTMIKPAIKKIRQLGLASKILQMEMVPDPHGKLTYPDEIKIAMFKTIYHAFQPWQNKVFMYLCMEKAKIWEKAFGFVYNSNEEFETEFLRQSMSKIAAASSHSIGNDMS